MSNSPFYLIQTKILLTLTQFQTCFFTRSQLILFGNNMCNQTLFVPSENMLYSMSYFPNTESSSGEFWNYIIYQA